MNRSLSILCAVMLIFAMVETAGASLIGDTVSVAHEYNGHSIFGPQDTVVAAGTSDVVTGYNGLYNVNVEAYSIDTDFTRSSEWSDIGGFNGLVVDSLDDDSGNLLQGVAIDTNMSGWDASRLSYGVSLVRFNWQGLSFTSSTYFNASLDFGQNAVPIPGAVWLLGSGLFGLVTVRRRQA